MNDSPDSSNQNAEPPKRQNSTGPSGGLEPLDAEIVEDATAPPPPSPVPDYDDRGVPSLDYVRDKIESRYATSLGAAELAENTPRPAASRSRRPNASTRPRRSWRRSAAAWAAEPSPACGRATFAQCGCGRWLCRSTDDQAPVA